MRNRALRVPRIAWLLVLALAGSATLPAELAVVDRWPADENACVDTPLRLTFDGPPSLGTSGEIAVCRTADGMPVEKIELGGPLPLDRFGIVADMRLRYEPVWIDGNTAQIRLHAGLLKPGESYFVRISAGVFQDSAGTGFPGVTDGWKFRTKTTVPREADRLTVAADGSGDFCTVQGAVDQVGPNRDRPTVIFVRRGRYHELVRIGRAQGHIRLIGEDRHGTVISCTNNEKLNSGWIQRAVLGCEGDDFTLENLTVQNSTPYKGSQAEAVSIRADRCVLQMADFLSFQDTLNLSGRVYVADCRIEGDVDYVWGYGTACFDRCELCSMHDGYLVQARNPASRPGYVFLDCRLTAAPNVKKCWLARIEAERFPASHVAFIHCAMGAHIPPAGWQVTGEAAKSLRFEESASTNLEGKSLDLTARLPASKKLTNAEAASISPASVLAGSDNWIPNAPSN